jgi:hypothetical protein
MKKYKSVGIVLVLVVIITGYLIFKEYRSGSKYEFKPTLLSVVDLEDIGELYVAKYVGEVIASTTDNALLTRKAILEEIEEIIGEIKIIDVPENEANKETYSLKKANAMLQKRYNNDDIAKIARDKADMNCFLNGYKSGMQLGAGIKLSEVFKLIVKGVAVDRSELSDDVMEAIKNSVNRDSNKKKHIGELAYLARGTVNVGFDLKDLNESDVIIEEKEGKKILKIRPTIVIHCVINPTFIVVAGGTKNVIRGYDLIKGKNMRFDLSSSSRMLDVKKQCKAKLVEFALIDGIIKISRKNGCQTLKGFLSLFNKFNVNGKNMLTKSIDKVEIELNSDKVTLLPNSLMKVQLKEDLSLMNLIKEEINKDI